MLTALCMLLSLAACGGGGDTAVTEKPEENPWADTKPVTVDGLELGAGLAEQEPAAPQLDENPDRDIDRAVEPIKPVPGTMLDGTPLGDEFYYYRSTLDDTYRQAYDLLRAGMLEGKTKIKMTVPVQKEDIANLYKMVIYDSPDLFWAEINGARYAYNNRGLVTTMMPSYNDLVTDINGNTLGMEFLISDALADMWSLPTAAEKAKYAHDYLTNTVSYQLGAPYNQTAYGALVENATVCAGYSHAFQYMMQKVGIPCAYVLGYVPGGYHAWNVLLLDGEHYAMDVTWDDPLGAPAGKYYYNYFNITDAKISADHSRAEASKVIPAAEGTACSFQNAFDGKAYGTDFYGIVGVMPEKVGGDKTEPKVDNPYLS